MVLHFLNNRNNRALCSGVFARGYKSTTTDTTKVTCTRCAKILGIIPAAKPASKHRTGTCQCCFNSQKVNQAGGLRISLHGYKRPGKGYITGRCRGEYEVPFEVSCEKTKAFAPSWKPCWSG